MKTNLGPRTPDETLRARGRIAELRDIRCRLRYEIDVFCKGIIDLFSPLDNDCAYCDTLNTVRLRVHTDEIIRKSEVLQQSIAEGRELAAKIGEVFE